MKNLQLILLAAVVAFGCDRKDRQEDVLATINSDVIQNSIAYSALGESSKTIGHRLTGSENGAMAEQFIFDKLKSFGYEDVRFQEFEVEAWSRGHVQLTLNTDGTVAEVPTVSLGHSPLEAIVTGEIVDMGNGLEKDYENIGDRLKDKLALIFIGIAPGTSEGEKNLHRSEKAELAILNGASGVIIYNQVPNGVLLTGTASVSGELLPVPAICIGYEDGLAIKESLAEEARVLASINMTNNSGLIQARNVIATLPGTKLPEERVIVGGHQLSPKRTVQFAFFMGEEQGLLGSTFMVEEAEQDGSIENIKFMMNLDMTGNPVGINAVGQDLDTAFSGLQTARRWLS